MHRQQLINNSEGKRLAEKVASKFLFFMCILTGPHSAEFKMSLRLNSSFNVLFAQNVCMFLISRDESEGKTDCMKLTVNIMYHSQAFMTRSPRTSGFQSSQEVSNPSAKRIQKFLKWPLLTRDSEEQAVISVLSMVRTRAEPVSKSMVWLA